MPARIRSFEVGSKEAYPLDFEIIAGSADRLEIVLSLAASDVVVRVNGLPADGNVVAILAPSDPMIAPQESCILNTLAKNETRFRFLAPGRYRLFVVDSRFQSDVAKYATRLTNFLTSAAVTVDAVVGSLPVVTANYIQPQTVEDAIRQADRLR